MKSHIQDDIQELIREGVISDEIGNRITTYYKSRDGSGSDRLVVIFGILGALLVGMGIILIVAHNWDSFPTAVRVSFAFLPLALSQIYCGVILIRPVEKAMWRESCAPLLFASVAASISLISQIYNIHGNLVNFLLVWTILCAPIMYLLRSGSAFMLYVVCTTYFIGQASYIYPFRDTQLDKYLLYLPLMVVAVPFYRNSIIRGPGSNWTYLFHWFIALSLTFALGAFTSHSESIWSTPAYFALFGIFILLDKLLMPDANSFISGGYRTIGSIGTMIVLLMATYEFLWDHHEYYVWEFPSTGLISLVILLILGIVLLARARKTRSSILGYVFVAFLPVFIVGFANVSVARGLENLLTLVVAVWIIRDGVITRERGRMNYGLLLMSLLIILRFFDADISFVARGLVFILVGAGFFIANLWMAKTNRNEP